MSGHTYTHTHIYTYTDTHTENYSNPLHVCAQMVNNHVILFRVMSSAAVRRFVTVPFGHP